MWKQWERSPGQPWMTRENALWSSLLVAWCCHADGSWTWKGFDGQGHQGIGSFPKEAREKNLDEAKREVPHVAPETPHRAVQFTSGS